MDNTVGLDELLRRLQVARDVRDSELREAFRDSRAMYRLVSRDAIELIVGVGGYAAPIDPEERMRWIERMMLHDPRFRACVEATRRLVTEYVDYAGIVRDLPATPTESTRKY